MRKPTPEERREIVINYIIKHSGQKIDIAKLAQKLAVSKRTIQSLLNKLKAEGLIAIEPTFDCCGYQGHNKYSYIGPPVERYGSGLTIGMLYDPKNRAGSAIGIGMNTALSIRDFTTSMTCMTQNILVE